MNRFLLACGLLILATTLALAQSASTDTRHPLVKALDYDTNLLMVNNLRLTTPQVANLQRLAAQTAETLNSSNQAHANALKTVAPLLEQEIKALADGVELDAATARQLDIYRAAEADRHSKLLVAINAQIRLFRRSLTNQQAALFNWQCPPDMTPPPDRATTLQEMQALSARLLAAQGLIERIRYLIASDYSITRIGRIETYLRDYLEPNTPRFNEARDFLLNLVDQARRVDEKDWPGQAPLFAAQVLQHLNLLNPEEQPMGVRTPYNWWDAYSLLTDNQTQDLTQAILNARANQR